MGNHEMTGESMPAIALYMDTVMVIAEMNDGDSVSLSMLQRRLLVGFAKASELFNQLHRDGLISSDGRVTKKPKGSY